MEYSIDMDHKTYAVRVLENLNEMRQNSQQCDFTIKVESEEFPVHRNVLSAASDYFKAMLTHDTEESQSGFVKMKYVSPEGVKVCIDYIYSGKLSIAKTNIEQLLNVASMMQLNEMCDGIFGFLGRELTPCSFYSTKEIANLFNATQLTEKCKLFAKTNFLSIVRQDDFCYLEDEFISFIIGSKKTKVSEAAKCKALIIWTKFDTEARKSTFCDVFSKLNLGKIALHYRKYLVEKETSLLNSTSYMNKILESRMFNKQCHIEAKDIDFNLDIEDSNNVIAVFDRTSKSIEGFDPKQKLWMKLCDASDEFIDYVFSAILVDDIIYVFVSDNCNYSLNYTESNAKWLELPCRTVSTNRVIAVAVGSIIYAFDDSGEDSLVEEKFDMSAQTWSYATDRPECVFGCLAAVIAMENFIYVFGGNYEVGAAKFDSIDSNWTALENLPTKRYGAGVAEVDGKIYVIGGWTYEDSELTTVEYLDTVTEMWTKVADLNITRGSYRACVVGGNIYAVGGESSNDTIEELDLSTNTWKVIETMSGRDYESFASLALNSCI